MDTPPESKIVHLIIQSLPVWSDSFQTQYSLSTETVTEFLTQLLVKLKVSRVQDLVYQNTSILRDSRPLNQIFGDDPEPSVFVSHIAPMPLLLPKTIGLETSGDLPICSFLEELGFVSSSCPSPPDHGDTVCARKFTKEQTGAFLINPKAKEFLKEIQEPFAVISISGAARSGKSTLLTYFLRELSGDPSGCFEWSNRPISCTVGIWMWPELITWVDPSTGKERKILLLDLEGLGGNDWLSSVRLEGNQNYFLELFAFSCMISSLVMFNSISVPVTFNDTSWSEISSLAEALKKFSHGEGENNWLNNSPYFLYIARKHLSFKTIKQDTQFWKAQLRSRATVWIQKFRELFGQTFDKNNFLSLMEIPKENTRDQFDLATLTPEEINPRFLEKLKMFFDESLGEILEDFSVTHMDSQGFKTEQVVGGYDQIIEKILSVVSKNELSTLAPIVQFAAENTLRFMFKQEMNKVKQQLRGLILPFKWEEFWLQMEFTKEKLLAKLVAECISKGVCPDFFIIEEINDALANDLLALKEENDAAIQVLIREMLDEKRKEYDQLPNMSDVEKWIGTCKCDKDTIRFLAELQKELKEYHELVWKSFKALKKMIMTELLISENIREHHILRLPSGQTRVFESADQWLTFIREDPLVDERFLTQLQLTDDIGIVATKRLEIKINENEPKIPKWMFEAEPKVFEDGFINLHNEAVQQREKEIALLKFQELATSMLAKSKFFPNGLSYSFKTFTLESFQDYLVQEAQVGEDWIQSFLHIKEIEDGVPMELPHSSGPNFKDLIIETLKVAISADHHVIIRVTPKKKREEGSGTESLAASSTGSMSSSTGSGERIISGKERIRDFLSLWELNDQLVGLKLLGTTETYDSWMCFLKEQKHVDKLFYSVAPPDMEITRRIDSSFLIVESNNSTEPITIEKLKSLCNAYVNELIVCEPRKHEDANAPGGGHTPRAAGGGGGSLMLLLAFANNSNVKDCDGKSFSTFNFSLPLVHELSEAQFRHAQSQNQIIQATATQNKKFQCLLWPTKQQPLVPLQVPPEKKNRRYEGEDEPTLEQRPILSPSPGSLVELPMNIFAGTDQNLAWWVFANSIDAPHVQQFFSTVEGMHIWDANQCKLIYDHLQADHPDRLGALRVIVAAATQNILTNRFYYLKDADDKVIRMEANYIRPVSQHITLNPLTALPPSLVGLSTSVSVIPSDTFDAVSSYLEANPGHRVLVLNLASSVYPGGGWRNGRNGQEEDLFRRSNLSKTLHLSMYPIPEFGALISRGITVFRKSCEEGYALLTTPFQCDVISACAYDANLEPNILQKSPSGLLSLTPHYVVKTFRKIITVFQYIAQNKYDHVVLGALGCGNFKNPAADIAKIFHEALKQYAGLIPSITFAILEGLKDDNFGIFQKHLKPSYHAMNVEDPVFQEQLETVYLCPSGGQCPSQDEENRQLGGTIHHPARCPYKDNCHFYSDEIHSLCMGHPIQCESGNVCSKWSDNDHQELYLHPPKCQNLNCSNSDVDHKKNFWHAPVWYDPRDPNSSSIRISKDPMNSIGGGARGLTRGDKTMKAKTCWKSCRQFRDEGHNHKYLHPFHPPCIDILSCVNSSSDHKKKYSHLCRWGESCGKLNDPGHCKEYYHFLGHRCPDKDCKRIDEDHLSTYSHHGIADIRPPCINGLNCNQRFVGIHAFSYSHPPFRLKGISPVNPLAVEIYRGQSPIATVDQPIGINPTPSYLNSRITYFYNAIRARKEICQYAETQKQTFDTKNVDKVAKWLSQLLPIHRASKTAVCSMIRTGAIMSLHQLKNLDADSIIPLVLSRPEIQEQTRKEGIIQFVRLVVQYTIAEIKNDPSHVTFNPHAVEEARRQFLQQRDYIRVGYGPLTTELVETQARAITQAALMNVFDPLDYEVDKILWTDRTVFAVYGPSDNPTYGQVFILFKDTIKWHPNFYLTPHAATYFYDINRKHNALNCRPWGKDYGPEDWLEGPGQINFQESKFHPIAPDTWNVLALDLIARVGIEKKCGWDRVTLEDVQAWWSSVDSHKVIEAHLPYQVPLSYVEGLVLSRPIWNTFSEEERALAFQIFGESNVHITEENAQSYIVSKDLCSRPIADQHKGFCFVVKRAENIEGYETFVPLKISSGSRTKTAIAFEAIGDQFVFCLCDQENHDKRDGAISIVIDSTRGCSISDGSPLKARYDHGTITRPSVSFNAGLPSTSKIHYQVIMDFEANSVTFSHYGSSELYCVSPPLVFTSTCASLRSLCYFSFSVYGHSPVELYNVMSVLAPFPSVLEPQELPSSIPIEERPISPREKALPPSPHLPKFWTDKSDPLYFPRANTLPIQAPQKRIKQKQNTMTQSAPSHTHHTDHPLPPPHPTSSGSDSQDDGH